MLQTCLYAAYPLVIWAWALVDVKMDEKNDVASQKNVVKLQQGKKKSCIEMNGITDWGVVNFKSHEYKYTHKIRI